MRKLLWHVLVTWTQAVRGFTHHHEALFYTVSNGRENAIRNVRRYIKRIAQGHLWNEEEKSEFMIHHVEAFPFNTGTILVDDKRVSINRGRGV